MTARDVVQHVTSGRRIFVHGAAATPTPLLESLVARSDLDGVSLYHLHTSGPCHFADPGQSDHFRSVSLFAGPALRKPIDEGRADFIHGAALSRGGRPILALPSTAAGGKVSRLVPLLKPGAGVVTTRGHVHWIITEYGAVNLHGKTLRERAGALISIAHPDFRAELRHAAAEIRHFTFGGAP